MSEIQYATKEEAQVVRERKQVAVDRELKRIIDNHGTVTTDLLLEEARSPTHPLHKYFEWDDSVAAEKYRQQQALSMIMASRMVASIVERQRNGPPKVVGTATVRQLVSPFRKGGFKMRNEALNEADARKAMVERKISALRSWLRETVDLPELSQLRSAIERHLPK